MQSRFRQENFRESLVMTENYNFVVKILFQQTYESKRMEFRGKLSNEVKNIVSFFNFILSRKWIFISFQNISSLKNKIETTPENSLLRYFSWFKSRYKMFHERLKKTLVKIYYLCGIFDLQ